MRKIIYILNLISAYIVNARVKKIYQNKLFKLKNMFPHYFTTKEKQTEDDYVRYWSRFGWNVSADWYRYYVNRSGIDLISYVPNDVFYVVIDRVLNDPNEAINWSNKNLFDKLFASEHFPTTLLRIMSGEIYDKYYNEISLKYAKSILAGTDGDLVVKKAEESCGGHGVSFITEKYDYNDKAENKLNLNELINTQQSYVIQKYIQQSDITSCFNPPSANTFRVVTLRLPGSGNIVVLKRILRMGVGNIKVDNQSSGGISVGIFADGRMNDLAFDGNGVSFVTHPVTGIRFSERRFDQVAELDSFALLLARGVPSIRLLSLDIMICADGSFKCLEVNANGGQIDFLQVYDGGLFDPYTDVIVDYCLSPKKQNLFKHIRGFYY